VAPPFKLLDGVIKVTSGYTGGLRKNPTYIQVCSGVTGHYEAVDILFDPSKINYQTLLETFWRQIDPTDAGGQFADRGPQYQTVIFYHSPEQKRLAEDSKAKLQTYGVFNQPIITNILTAQEFYPAEEYHQDYHQKNHEHYQRYRKGSGRENYLEKTWAGRDDL
jgi:peptide methionine sulfoxide reductase msrA/msrB